MTLIWLAGLSLALLGIVLRIRGRQDKIYLEIVNHKHLCMVTMFIGLLMMVLTYTAITIGLIFIVIGGVILLVSLLIGLWGEVLEMAGKAKNTKLYMVIGIVLGLLCVVYGAHILMTLS